MLYNLVPSLSHSVYRPIQLARGGQFVTEKCLPLAQPCTGNGERPGRIFAINGCREGMTSMLNKICFASTKSSRLYI